MCDRSSLRDRQPVYSKSETKKVEKPYMIMNRCTGSE